MSSKPHPFFVLAGGLAAAASFRISFLIEASNFLVGTFSKSFFLPSSICESLNFQSESKGAVSGRFSHQEVNESLEFQGFLPFGNPCGLTVSALCWQDEFPIQQAHYLRPAFVANELAGRNILQLNSSSRFNRHTGALR
ncbi:MAG: hypothetical protein WBE13_11720 [Candidatus Acidiferrum sp.]